LTLYPPQAILSAKVPQHVTGLIQAYDVTRSRSQDCIDGVHYADAVYDVLSQILLNQINALASPSPPASTLVPQKAPQHEVVRDMPVREIACSEVLRGSPRRCVRQQTLGLACGFCASPPSCSS
jgi:hypothetical protein